MQKNLTIKELPDTERPYEKCLLYGAGSLSDAELISVIIRTGSRGERCVDLAHRILNAGPDGLLNLIRLDTVRECCLESDYFLSEPATQH